MSELLNNTHPQTNLRLNSSNFVILSTRFGFYLLLVLLLLSHASAANPGPFGWLPHPQLQNQYHWQVGPLALLPFIILGGWVYSWSKIDLPIDRRWSWGRLEITLPMFGLTLLATIHLLLGENPTLANMLGLFWLIYLFQLNNPSPQNSPSLKWVFVFVLCGQSIIAILQFMRQRSLNLVWLGEAAMDLNTIGTSVVSHNGINWLRAYGLTSHPNQLGLLLVALLLILWPYRRTFHRSQIFIMLIFALGVMALVASWSRAAWLALIIGTAVYCVPWLLGKKEWHPLSWQKFVPLFFLAVTMIIFLFSYRDIVIGRLFLLDTPLESRSLNERKRDTTIALQIIEEHALFGVGLGNYQTVANKINPSAQIVHNVPLLIAAEFGLLGLLLWLVFLIAPLLRAGTFSTFLPQTAVWLALITISIWQPEPHLFLTKGAVLWGLAAAAWSRPLQLQTVDLFLIKNGTRTRRDERGKNKKSAPRPQVAVRVHPRPKNLIRVIKEQL